MKFFQNTETTTQSFVATALAHEDFIYVPFDRNDRRYAVHGYGENLPSSNFITVTVGDVHGMTHVCEGWTDSNPTFFETAQEAKLLAGCLPAYSYNLKLIPGTIQVHEVIRHSRVEWKVERV